MFLLCHRYFLTSSNWHFEILSPPLFELEDLVSLSCNGRFSYRLPCCSSCLIIYNRCLTKELIFNNGNKNNPLQRKWLKKKNLQIYLLIVLKITEIMADIQSSSIMFRELYHLQVAHMYAPVLGATHLQASLGRSCQLLGPVLAEPPRLSKLLLQLLLASFQC